MIAGSAAGKLARPWSAPDDTFAGNEHIGGLLERLRREPALRAWVLAAPTGALATLGVALDDNGWGTPKSWALRTN